MTTKLLIDECLSPHLVALAKSRGIAADFGPYVGKQGGRDDSLVAFAIGNNYAIVTNNRRDFLKQYLKRDLHAGHHHRAAGRPDRANPLFGLALDRIATFDDALLNRVIEVLEDGTVHVRQWTSGAHDPNHIAAPDWSR